MNSPTRYAIIGTGSRALMYRDALLKTYASTCHLAAICDPNALRMSAWQADVEPKIPAYSVDAFEAMIREQKIATLIVTSIDRTHHDYICRAMELGCDVITEKPMTIDAPRCRQIIQTQRKTGRQLTVTFNYRYSQRNSKVKELLQSGTIGDVTSVHFEWLLDTKHGADYFRRWHRDRRNSGGLMVHKSTHHFDLVNWWLDTQPETVMAMGGLKFYGRENAELRGEPRYYVRSTGQIPPIKDPFALDLAASPDLKRLYLDCEKADGYLRDQNVFGDGISIEDDVGLLVRYRNQAVMTYHLTAYSPWEGYRVAFNGTRGRLELEVVETPYVSGDSADFNFARNVKGSATHEVIEPVTLLLRPHWAPIQQIPLPQANVGGHGGADRFLLEELFGNGTASDPLGRAAGVRDGALSLLTGIAANISMSTGRPVDVAGLVPELDSMI